jgi:hypothetical protein
VLAAGRLEEALASPVELERPGRGASFTITNEARIATASSMKAAGRSLPKAIASFARAACPPSVLSTAPMMPAIAPTISEIGKAYY